MTESEQVSTESPDAGRRAVVTGASSGIGEATVRENSSVCTRPGEMSMTRSGSPICSSLSTLAMTRSANFEAQYPAPPSYGSIPAVEETTSTVPPPGARFKAGSSF